MRERLFISIPAVLAAVLTSGCTSQELVEFHREARGGYCFDINEPGTYYLDEDIADADCLYCVNITSSDVILDCQNHTIDGSTRAGSIGVNVQGTQSSPLENIEVRNCYVQEWVKAVRFIWTRDSLFYNIHTNNTGTDEGAGIVGRSSDNVMLDHITVNDTGDGSFMRGHGIAFGGVNNTLLCNFVVNWSGDIGVIPNGYNNVVENGDLWYCARALGCSFPNSQNNTFRNIRVHIMRYDSGGLGKSVIDLGEATGGIEPHKFYNNWFNRSGPRGEVDYIEDCSYGGSDPEALFSTEKKAGTNIAGGAYLAGNYWADRDGDAFSDTCTDSDGDGLCDSGYRIPCSGSCDYTYTDRRPLAGPPG